MSEDFIPDALLKIHTNLDTFQGESKLPRGLLRSPPSIPLVNCVGLNGETFLWDAVTDAGTALPEILMLPSIWKERKRP